MGREIRMVPVKWKHPKDGRQYKALYDDYVGVLKYYKDDVEQFIRHMTEVIEKGKTKIYDIEYTDREEVYDNLTEAGINPPNIRDYMPSGPWYQLFETVSEGTPLSPAFSTKEELVEWLTNNDDYWGHRWSREQAEGMVKTEWVPSGVVQNGTFYNAEESAEFLKGETK